MSKELAEMFGRDLSAPDDVCKRVTELRNQPIEERDVVWVAPDDVLFSSPRMKRLVEEVSNRTQK